ncbi:MAG: efflux RND transporter periplasmic adaptor subunit [Leptospirillia bacterium]
MGLISTYRKKIVGLLGLFSVLLIAFFLYRHFSDKGSGTSPSENTSSLPSSVSFDPTRFRIGHVKYRHFELWTTIPGVIHGFRKAIVYGHVPGYLKFLNVDKGDWVIRGQVLGYIYDPELYQSWQKALAEAAIAHITFLRKLHVWEGDHRVISLQRVQMAEALWKEREAQAGYFHSLVRYKTIVAPFTGIITHRYVDPWNLVSRGTGGTTPALPIVKIEDVDEMRLYVGVPEHFVRFVKRGLKAELSAQGLPGKVFRARVTRYAFRLNPETRTMRTEIDVDNPDHLLQPGMFVDARIRLHVYPHVLSVHHMAVIEERHGNFIYVLEHGVTKKRPIVVGIRNGDYTEILQGLNETEKVLVKLHKTIF